MRTETVSSLFDNHPVACPFNANRKQKQLCTSTNPTTISSACGGGVEKGSHLL